MSVSLSLVLMALLHRKSVSWCKSVDSWDNTLDDDDTPSPAKEYFYCPVKGCSMKFGTEDDVEMHLVSSNGKGHKKYKDSPEINYKYYKFGCFYSGCHRRFQRKDDLFCHLYRDEIDGHHCGYTCLHLQSIDDWITTTKATNSESVTRNKRKNANSSNGEKSSNNKKQKRNAFDILMRSAKVPNAFSYRFKLLSEEEYILFILPKHYSDYEQYRKHGCTDQVLNNAMVSIANHAYEASKTIDQRQRIKVIGPNNQILPPPPMEPSSGACIQSLTVCFMDPIYDSSQNFQLETHSIPNGDYWLEDDDDLCYDSQRDKDEHFPRANKILGFVLTYSDGIQLEIGNLRGTHREVTLVAPDNDDHISVVFAQPLYCDDDDEYNCYRNGKYELCVSTREESSFTFANGRISTNLGGHSSYHIDTNDHHDVPELEKLFRLIDSNDTKM